jgi:GTP-binding protein
MQLTAIYQKALFIQGAHELSQLPEDIGFEVAFAGRSNSGKSSAINAITGLKGLARTSKTPGRTQQILFFQLDESHHLVDLPGYGYAKVPLTIKQHWQKTLQNYLHTRRSLRGLILMMDIRHPLMEIDVSMLNWCLHSNMPVHVLLTKADKISHGKGSAVLQQVQKHLTNLSVNMSVQLFSALKRKGIEEAQKRIGEWLEISDSQKNHTIQP